MNLKSKKTRYLLLFLLTFSMNNVLHAQCTITQIGADIDGEADGDESGATVSISGDGLSIAIGAPNNNGAGDSGSRRGQVRIYKNINGAWIQQGADIDGETDNDGAVNNSITLSFDGKILAVGRPYKSGNGIRRGSVRVYKFNNGNWNKVGEDINGRADSDGFGNSVSLSQDGEIIAIGARINNINGNFQQNGYVNVLKNIGGTWVQQGAPIDGEEFYDGQGQSVALSNDGLTLAIGAPANSGGTLSASLRGNVRIYKYINGIWTKLGKNINGEADNDRSGTSVSLSADGKIVAIGAPRNSKTGFEKGHVRIFKYINGNWEQHGNDINGVAYRGNLGSTVSISADGLTLATGAPYTGEYKGQVKIYKYLCGTWIQRGINIDGEANSDFSGYSVSISADGSNIAIGSRTNKGGGFNRGHVRVFKLSCHSAEILVKGNNVEINNGEVIPNFMNGTNISTTFDTKNQNFKLFNNGNDTLIISSIESSGLNKLNFVLGTIPQKINIGDSAVFSIKFTPSSNDTHIATITIITNDMENGLFTFSVSGQKLNSSIQQSIFSDLYNFHPNPFTETLNLDLTLQPNETANITITDMLGKIVLNQTISNSKTALDLKHLDAGVYNAIIQIGDNIKTIKVIKI